LDAVTTCLGEGSQPHASEQTKMQTSEFAESCCTPPQIFLLQAGLADIACVFVGSKKLENDVYFFQKNKSNNTRGFRVKHHVPSSSLRTKIRWAKHRCKYCSRHLALRFPTENLSLGAMEDFGQMMEDFGRMIFQFLFI